MTTYLQRDDIMRQQITISMICNGITFGDTEQMSYHDRMFVFKELKKYKEEEAEALKEARRG